MVRPKKSRVILQEPEFTYFKPRAVPLRELEEVHISVDEFEAIRLKDHLGLGQTEVAKKMGLSQPSLHRLLKSARQKIASALVEGKAIRIRGGIYNLKR
jgi:predicted DNA-binding protein (UPF0251 family)